LGGKKRHLPPGGNTRGAHVGHVAIAILDSSAAGPDVDQIECPPGGNVIKSAALWPHRLRVCLCGHVVQSNIDCLDAFTETRTTGLPTC
jgi:hypothetical protein